jgi:hypothetical protein
MPSPYGYLSVCFTSQYNRLKIYDTWGGVWVSRSKVSVHLPGSWQTPYLPGLALNFP